MSRRRLFVTVGVLASLSVATWLGRTEFVEPRLTESDETLAALDALVEEYWLLCLCLGRPPTAEEIRDGHLLACKTGGQLNVSMVRKDGWGREITIRIASSGMVATSYGGDEESPEDDVERSAECLGVGKTDRIQPRSP